MRRFRVPPPIDPAKVGSGHRDMTHPPVTPLPKAPPMPAGRAPHVMATGKPAPKTHPTYGMTYPIRYVPCDAEHVYMG